MYYLHFIDNDEDFCDHSPAWILPDQFDLQISGKSSTHCCETDVSRHDDDCMYHISSTIFYDKRIQIWSNELQASSASDKVKVHDSKTDTALTFAKYTKTSLWLMSWRFWDKIWCKADKSFNNKNTRPRIKHDCESAMVWRWLLCCGTTYHY